MSVIQAVLDDKRKLAALGVAAVVVVAGGAAAAYRVLDDDTPAPTTDAGSPVTQSTTTDGNTEPTTPSEPEGAPLADVSLTLTEIGEFNRPIAMVPRVDDTSLYVAERDGRVIRLTVEGEGTDRTYTADDEPLIDISDQVTDEGERGLLDIELSPDGQRLYMSYSQAPTGESKIVSYGFDGTTVDTGSRKEILTVSDFAANHNGGDITFGPDGYLYIAMGDGGGGGDPEENGQDLESLLGKILRVDAEGAVGTDEPYLIPPDNPYADGGGKPEIWIYGVRNPWRYSFDSANGDLWIADVGQNTWEEIDYLSAASGGGRGVNLGWNDMEGAHGFNGGSNPPGATLPIFEYPTGEGGCAITGGYVYRGSANPDLTGAYLFGDYCQSPIRAIRQNGGTVDDERVFDAGVAQLASFAQDNEGEIYAISQGNKILRLDP